MFPPAEEVAPDPFGLGIDDKRTESGIARILVKGAYGILHEYSVRVDKPLQDLANRIASTEGAEDELPSLYDNNTKLDLQESLTSLKIPTSRILYVQPRSYVRVAYGRESFEIDVIIDETVEELMAAIFMLKGYPIENQIISINKRHTEPNLTLSSYGIRGRGDTIELGIRLPGGNPPLYALALYDWSGSTKYSQKGLPLLRSGLLSISPVFLPNRNDWCRGHSVDQGKDIEGIIPKNYITILDGQLKEQSRQSTLLGHLRGSHKLNQSPTRKRRTSISSNRRPNDTTDLKKTKKNPIRRFCAWLARKLRLRKSVFKDAPSMVNGANTLLEMAGPQLVTKRLSTKLHVPSDLSHEAERHLYELVASLHTDEVQPPPRLPLYPFQKSYWMPWRTPLAISLGEAGFSRFTVRLGVPQNELDAYNEYNTSPNSPIKVPISFQSTLSSTRRIISFTFILSISKINKIHDVSVEDLNDDEVTSHLQATDRTTSSQALTAKGGTDKASATYTASHSTNAQTVRDVEQHTRMKIESVLTHDGKARWNVLENRGTRGGAPQKVNGSFTLEHCPPEGIISYRYYIVSQLEGGEEEKCYNWLPYIWPGKMGKHGLVMYLMARLKRVATTSSQVATLSPTKSAFNSNVTLYSLSDETIASKSASTLPSSPVSLSSSPVRRSKRAKIEKNYKPSGNCLSGSEENSNDGSDAYSNHESEDEPTFTAVVASTSTSTTTVKTAKRKSPSKSPSKKTGTRMLEAQLSQPPPLNWLSVYEEIKKMRTCEGGPATNAAVDTMGCSLAQRNETDPKSKRYSTLVSLMLSSQTKDTICDPAVIRLREAVGGTLTIENILAADIKTIEKAIYPVGFWQKKARYLKEAAQQLKDNFDSELPKTAKELITLKGVGPKMAHLCLQAAWGISEGIGVDVHVDRITNRLGWNVPSTLGNPERTRINLESWLPKDRWAEINFLLVGFGQTVCTPRNTKCNLCTLSSKGLCPNAYKEASSSTKESRAVLSDAEDNDGSYADEIVKKRKKPQKKTSSSRNIPQKKAALAEEASVESSFFGNVNPKALPKVEVALEGLGDANGDIAMSPLTACESDVE